MDLRRYYRRYYLVPAGLLFILVLTGGWGVGSWLSTRSTTREAQAPGQEARAPGREARAPGQEARAPGQEARAAGREAKAVVRQGTSQQAGRGVSVEVIRLRLRDFSVTSTYIGHLLPWERVSLRAELDGMAESADYEEGDRVGPDRVLVNISTDRLKVRRDLARSDHQLAESNYLRDADLFKRSLIPNSRLDQTRNRRDVAKLSLRLAEIELEKSTVRSPIAGIVKSKGVERGEYVNKGQMLAEVLNVSRLRARFDVPEGEIRHLVRGKQVRLTLDALPGEEFQGVVKTVGLEADRTTRTFPVEVALDNPRERLRAGMLARVRVPLLEYRQQVLVPRHAVLEREHGRAVFVVRDGRALEVPIRTGAASGENLQVLEGLRSGDRVVVTGQQKLVHQEPVRITRTLP